MKKLFVSISIIFVLYSCRKGSENIPGSISVEGKTINLQYAYAVKEKTSSFGKGGYLINLFNHNKNTCKEITAKSRQVHTGEISARIYADEGGSWSVVGIEYHSQLGVKVKTLKTTNVIGDEVILSVPSKITFKPLVGTYKGKEVTIVGTFKGKYCGERQN